jgi:protein MpaA
VRQAAGPLQTPRRSVFGSSRAGRPLAVTELGDPRSPRRVLVVGCIHGNEAAGIAVAQRLLAEAAAPDLDLWVVPDLNPDGVAAHTRGNGRGVDLNRNFPFRWRPLSGTFYSGPAPASEPETRAVAALIRRIRPTVAIWFHQHLAVVDTSEGPLPAERAFAEAARLPLARLTDYPGSATGWEDALRPASAFVVELPAGSPSPAQAARYALAVRRAARA